MSCLLSNQDHGKGQNQGYGLGKDYWTEGSANDFVVNVEYNYVHDFGVGITSDFGAIKTGSKADICDSVDEAGLEQSCYTYIKLFNNLVRDGWPYYCCANFLYSDTSSSKNLFENNIIYGSGDEKMTVHFNFFK